MRARTPARNGSSSRLRDVATSRAVPTRRAVYNVLVGVLCGALLFGGMPPTVSTAETVTPSPETVATEGDNVDETADAGTDAAPSEAEPVGVEDDDNAADSDVEPPASESLIEEPAESTSTEESIVEDSAILDPDVPTAEEASSDGADVPVIARIAAGGTYCTAPGVYSLDDSVASTTSSVRSLALTGVGGADTVTGTQRWQSDALGIVPDGSAAWAATRYNSTSELWISRLGADEDTAVEMHYRSTGLGNLGTVTAGAVTRVRNTDYFYFGSFTRLAGDNQRQVYLELFAFNITTNTWIGQVGRVQVGTTNQATGAGAGGDIAFDAQGRLIVLWSDESAASRLYRLNTVPTTAGTGALATTTLTTAVPTTANQPWNGLAYDTTGNLWISRANVTASPRTSTFAIVNTSTGGVSSITSKSGFAVNDLASCYNTPPTLTVQKSLPIGRFASGDQFTLDVRQSGSTTNLTSATTTGTGIGIQSPTTGATNLTAGATYTIAETGANGANLANYTLSFGCVWSDGDVFVAEGTALTVEGGRAQATLPAVPVGRNAQALTCTITNVAKAVALTLQASLTNARFAATDQFTLDIRQSGSQTNLSQATTTTSAATGPQAPAAGPLNVVAGAVYTIAQTGAAGASLGAYTFTYGCVWADGSTFVAAGSSLTYNINTGRASATLPGIPTGRDGQALACTVVNTAKNAADVPPRLDLQKNIASRTAGHQFHLAVNRTFDNALLTENTTTGTTNGLQTATVARTTAEQGVTYTISEGAAGSAGTLLGYAASFVCTWSGGAELARGVLSVGANGRLQSMLPAIPAGYNGQVLTCTITNQLTPPQALDCSVDSVYALHRTTAGQYAKRVTSSGMSTGTTVPNRVSFGTTDNQNALAVNLDGSAAIAVTQAPNGSGQLVMRKWTAALGNGTPTASILTRTGATTPATPSDFVGGAIDPTTGDYYFGGYSGSNFRLFVVRADASTFQFVRNISIPDAGTGNANGDITFDASGNLYLVWSLGTTHVLARLDAGKVNSNGDAVRIAFLASNDTFNGIAFNGRGELFASGGFGIKRLDPSTGQPMGGTNGNGIVDTTTGVVDLASCGLPPTMRLQKEVDGRVVSTDQFGLEIRADGAGTGVDDVVVQSATTAGSTTGIQTQYAGSMVVTVGKSYVIREVGAPADLNRYIASYSCQWSDDTAPSDAAVLSVSGAARQASVGPIPSAADLGTARGKAGQQLVCTITNTPVFDATVVVTKTILDPNGANPTPGVGWAITSTRLTTSTAGTTISTPATKTTISGGAVPTPWTVGIPNSSAFVNLQVAEAQQSGHDLVPGTGSGSSLAGSYCTVTPPIGQPRTVLITATTVQVSGVKAGDRVECSFVNRQRAGSVTWQKVDAASTTTFLSGSE